MQSKVEGVCASLYISATPDRLRQTLSLTNGPPGDRTFRDKDFGVKEARGGKPLVRKDNHEIYYQHHSHHQSRKAQPKGFTGASTAPAFSSVQPTKNAG